jgi:phosphate/sulfate permease
MNFWQFVDKQIARLPGWPSERQWVTVMVFGLAYMLLKMAVANGDLWNVELFKIILQAVIISAIIGAVVAFHFTANSKHDRADTEPQPVKIEQPPSEPVPVEEQPS